MTKFVKSLRNKPTMMNDISRKTLLHMHEILTQTLETTQKDIEWYNLHHAESQIPI